PAPGVRACRHRLPDPPRRPHAGSTGSVRQHRAPDRPQHPVDQGCQTRVQAFRVAARVARAHISGSKPLQRTLQCFRRAAGSEPALSRLCADPQRGQAGARVDPEGGTFRAHVPRRANQSKGERSRRLSGTLGPRCEGHRSQGRSPEAVRPRRRLEMGLLDRVKASQTGATPAAPGSNGPPPPGPSVATATTPPPPNQTAPPQPPPASGGLSARSAAQAQRLASEPPVPGLSPAFTAAKVQVHARLLEKYADQL